MIPPPPPPPPPPAAMYKSNRCQGHGCGAWIPQKQRLELLARLPKATHRLIIGDQIWSGSWYHKWSKGMQLYKASEPQHYSFWRCWNIFHWWVLRRYRSVGGRKARKWVFVVALLQWLEMMVVTVWQSCAAWFLLLCFPWFGMQIWCNHHCLGGGFRYSLCSPLFGEMIPFD